MTRTKGILLLVAALLPGCRSAPKTPAATAVPLPDPLRSYEGALRLLPGRADEKALVLKPGSSLAGTCDLAVRVLSVAYDKGAARFALETVGEPRVGDRRPSCKRLQPGLALTIDGLGAGPLTAEATARIDAALLRPEEYLRRKGGAFDRPKGEAPSEVASQLPDASDSERRLARTVVAWPKPLLTVEALYHDASGKGRHERLVGTEAVVGGDGRAYRPKVKSSIDTTHQRALDTALELWRFEPARRADGPLAARVPLEVPLRVY